MLVITVPVILVTAVEPRLSQLGVIEIPIIPNVSSVELESVLVASKFPITVPPDSVIVPEVPKLTLLELVCKLPEVIVKLLEKLISEDKLTFPLNSTLLKMLDPEIVFDPEKITFPSFAVNVPLLVKLPFEDTVNSLELLA